ncbi:MAG: leucine--tRNA ligase [Saprospiraceae bacterium]|nr:leucine--tRNA ligase [Saprospiraceae bacterium]
MDYRPRDIEKKWRKYWVENETYRVSNDSDKPKFYVLDMFPYPSGAGLHVGHPLGYIASDIFARYKRLRGFNVLHPMGYDAFGLPAEQYAIQTGVHPAVSTDENIQRYREQLDNIGFSFDWSREVKTSDPSYYKWTQWIFRELFEHWYDKGQQKARPISELIAHLEKQGTQGLQAAQSEEISLSAEAWKKMSAKEQDTLLMDYRLAYRKTTYVNWCEELGTVLANDEVKDGVSERGGFPVERKPMLQWSLRITAYAERLLQSLQTLEWSEAMKKMQSNWIGRSEGAQVFFPIQGHDESIEVFTTRPDTIFGATFMVLAPEHDLVESLTTPDQRAAVDAYLEYAKSRSERDRMADVKEATGVFTGAYAINPLTESPIPIWLGEYVLKDYGTGAIMAVPSDDDRDHRFATKFGIEIIEVIDKSDYPNAGREDKVGKMINSGFLNGMEVLDAIEKTLQAVEERGIGSRRVNYRLRDAIYSRQRYWGEPFPIVYDPEGVAHSMEISELPLELPELEDFKPASGGKSPLARAEDWVNLPNGWERETDTMPGFAGSSWYFLRYMDAHNPEEFASRKALDYWQDVDLYVGGTEHAVGHLMYSRFWHKFLYDKGLVPTDEPFKKLINQGMIQGVIESMMMQKEKVNGYNRFVCADLAAAEVDTEFVKIPVHVDFVQNYGTPGSYMDTDSVKHFTDWRPEFQNAIFECGNGTYQNGKFQPKGSADGSYLMTVSEVGKMSKRYFNVVNPDDVVERYGADCFRMYEMFLGPVEQAKPWDTKGIDGVSKFLRKFWGLFFDEADALFVTDETPTKGEQRILHTCIKKITDDIERFSFNTCVAAFMIATNDLQKEKCNKRAILEPMLTLLAPFAPHLTEDLWHQLGHSETVHNSSFPVFDGNWLIEDSVSYPVSINGKKRAMVDFPMGTPSDQIEKTALELEEIKKWIDGMTVRKVIVVPNRMINIVVS